jgi:hypothetical protein
VFKADRISLSRDCVDLDAHPMAIMLDKPIQREPHGAKELKILSVTFQR